MPESHRSSEKSKHPSPTARTRRVLLAILLVVAILAAGVLYLRRHSISLLLSHSHEVDGQAGIAHLHLPPGFQMTTVFYAGLPAPRLITFSPAGTLFVADRGGGSVIALPDPKQIGQAAKKIVVASGLNDPTSLTFYQGALYVGEASQISRFTLDSTFHVTSKRVVIPGLPVGGDHARAKAGSGLKRAKK